MKELLKFLFTPKPSYIVTQTFITILLTVLVTESFEGIFSGSVRLFMGATLTALLFAIISIRLTYKATSEKLIEIKNEAEQHIHLHDIETKFLENTPRKDYGYLKSLDIIKKAKESIYIVGDFSPPNQKLNSTEERIDYLNAIEEVVRKYLSPEEHSKFIYCRIMQRPDNIYQKLKGKDVSEGISLTKEDMLGDEEAFKHCYEINLLKRSRPKQTKNVDIQLSICRFVPSLPSLLIVDNKHLLFTIPKKNSSFGNSKPISTIGVIHFIDKKDGQAIIKYFLDVFSSLQNLSIPIIDLPQP